MEAKFGQVDRLILRFNGTPDGLALIAAYQAARTVRGYGIRHEAKLASATGTAGATAQAPTTK